VDVVYPVPGRRRYAEVSSPPPDRRPATRTDRYAVALPIGRVRPASPIRPSCTSGSCPGPGRRRVTGGECGGRAAGGAVAGAAADDPAGVRRPDRPAAARQRDGRRRRGPGGAGLLRRVHHFTCRCVADAAGGGDAAGRRCVVDVPPRRLSPVAADGAGAAGRRSAVAHHPTRGGVLAASAVVPLGQALRGWPGAGRRSSASPGWRRRSG